MARAIFLLALVAAGAGVWYLLQSPETPIPNLDQDEWWGPKELRGRFDKSVQPFKVKFEDEMIKDLRNRLLNRRAFTPPLEGIAFEYGFNSKELNKWADYWAKEYNFTKQEIFLNRFPHFKTFIQGLDIHFIRVKPLVPTGVKILPLLLVHGWPGSVREFYEAIPLLTAPRAGYNFAFEVIIPSLPGYGFSDAAARPGLGVPQTAVIFKNLMSRLGHKKFYVQGGDWGAGVIAALSTLYPNDILGQHSNCAVVQQPSSMLKMIIGAYIPSLVVESHLADRLYPLSDFFSHMLEESGYFHLQSTKPDTIGIGLNDSPAGLLAYILEKFTTWTDKRNKFKQDGGLEASYTKDKLIDNIMLYWATNKITSSMRYYAENMSRKVKGLNLDSIKTPVPLWAYQAKHELFYHPPTILRLKYPNLINVTVSDDGGHFLALQKPKELTDDVFRAVKAFTEFHERKLKTEL